MKNKLLIMVLMLLMGARIAVYAQGLTVSDIEYIDEGYNDKYPMIILTKESSVLKVQLLHYSCHPYTERFDITPEMSSDGLTCSVSIGVVPINYSVAAVITTFNVSFNVHGIEANNFYFSCWWHNGMVSLTEGKPLELWENKNISKDGVTYILDNKTKTATLENGRFIEGEYNIPAELDYGGQTFNLTRINYPAFAYNTSLTSVIIPKSVTNIGGAAFYRCSNLTDLYCYAENVPATGINVFTESSIASATLHVPAGSIDKYKTTSPWSDFGSIVALPQQYFPEGTKWTEIRLDTLKYDSWYSKVDGEWVPNFETIEYRVQGEYGEASDNYWNAPYKCVYTNASEWTDSLTLLISEGGELNGLPTGVLVTVYDNYDDRPLWPSSYAFAWEIGTTITFKDILSANATALFPPGTFDFGVVEEINEGDFGGVRPLKYSDVKGVRMIQGIGVATWNDGECIFGPLEPYNALPTPYEESRHYRSMLVHFERDGEVLYDVWPKKEAATENPVTFTQNQMATIILPTAPDASKGKYYRLDRVENGQIVFEQEKQPRARVPYIIVPSEDFSIDISSLDLESLQADTVTVGGVSFIGSYVRKELPALTGGDGGGSLYYDIIDTTPDCGFLSTAETGKEAFRIGALRAYLTVNWDDPYNHHGSKGPEDKLDIVLKDDGTGSLTPTPSPGRGEIYDLSGRKWSMINGQFSMPKGIYIQNNRKLVK